MFAKYLIYIFTVNVRVQSHGLEKNVSRNMTRKNMAATHARRRDADFSNAVPGGGLPPRGVPVGPSCLLLVHPERLLVIDLRRFVYSSVGRHIGEKAAFTVVLKIVNKTQQHFLIVRRGSN